MEPILLTCMVIAFFLTKGKVDSTAYANGKEPPGVAKARMRHEAGGGARSASGRPKGKGALRLMLADRWANACEAARQRGEHKARRRRAWYDETAPLRDAEWREKQLAKLEKKNAARARWAADRGLIDLSERRERKAEDEAWKENERRDAEAAESAGEQLPGVGTIAGPDDVAPEGEVITEEHVRAYRADVEETHRQLGLPTDNLWGEAKAADSATSDSKPTDGPEGKDETTPADDAKAEETKADPETAAGENITNDKLAEASASAETPASNATEGTSNVYEQAVARLIAAADQVAEYRADLAAFADTLDGKRWGTEVTGPIKDMDGQLVALEGDYRDLAGQMKQQGDAGATAHEQAPWVPADDSILV